MLFFFCPLMSSLIFVIYFVFFFGFTFISEPQLSLTDIQSEATNKASKMFDEYKEINVFIYMILISAVVGTLSFLILNIIVKKAKQAYKIKSD